MPILTAHRFYTIALVAGLGASIVSLAHAGRPDDARRAASVMAQSARAQAAPQAPQMCAARHSPPGRMPFSKRYLNRTRVSRVARRDK